MKKLPQYKPKVVEEAMLKAWQDEGTFAATLQKTKNGKPFSFYDGPPFANGLPHFGHSLVTSIKDSIGRFQTMKGRYVERRNGWDCHGLPVEFEIEKQFNVVGKQQIMELGLEKFNNACRDSVFKYKSDWESYFDRIGRWTDKENAYATIDNQYIESEWWTFAQIYKKGLIYKGFKCMPYCPRCATPLSNFEVNEGYKDNVSDPSVIVKFKLQGEQASLLAWTTTPWSLPGNCALAIAPNANYLLINVHYQDGTSEQLIIAEKRLESIKTDSYEVLKTIAASDLVGKSYQPLFDIKGTTKHQNLYKIWAVDFVSVDDGTGILHVAPAFGEDDLTLGQQKDIPIINTIDLSGKVKQNMGLDAIEGKFFKSADKIIIEELTKQGKIYSAETFAHTYPYCYRCDTPLLYYAIDTWFIAVSTIKKELLAAAQEINWTPSNIKAGSFGKWLEGARDWAVSRNRYWGAPMPIWVNIKDESDIVVVESIEELQKLAGPDIDLSDLHRPFIDSVTIQKGKKVYKRVEEVLDCWFDSGSMPIAQQHYPFENTDKFKNSLPADFIGEGLDQTRLWFYVLHVISTIVLGKPAYRNVLVNGMITAADGQKLSKRLKNYPPLQDVFDLEGADSLRYYLLSSAPALSADNMRFDRASLSDINRNLFMTLYNSASFMSLYSEIDNWKPESLDMPTGLENPLDIWLVARVSNTIKEVTTAANNFELAKACWPVYKLVDDLSNWYVRRSRRRFWKSEDDLDKSQAYQTLHWSLVTICQLLAPWAPFMSDWLYRHLTADILAAPQSVHLSDWPNAHQHDGDILVDMDAVRRYVNDGLAKRSEHKIKVRQPLQSVVLYGPKKITKELSAIIADELNVKEVQYKKSDLVEVQLDTNISPTLRNEGLARDIIRNVQSCRKEAGLAIENRIKLAIITKSSILKLALEEYQELVSHETLAKEYALESKSYQFKKTLAMDGDELIIELEKHEA